MSGKIFCRREIFLWDGYILLGVCVDILLGGDYATGLDIYG